MLKPLNFIYGAIITNYVQAEPAAHYELRIIFTPTLFYDHLINMNLYGKIIIDYIQSGNPINSRSPEITSPML